MDENYIYAEADTIGQCRMKLLHNYSRETNISINHLKLIGSNGKEYIFINIFGLESYIPIKISNNQLIVNMKAKNLLKK